MHTPCREYEYRKVSTGSRVGKLLVLYVNGKSPNGSLMWRCICDCGKEVDVISSSLNNGLKQSCGCLYDELKGKQNSSHNQSRTQTYNSWLAMRSRCYNKKNQYYHLYGGRGIEVAPDWKDSFENFYRDMGDRPAGLTLERLDVNKGYSKENCKWASPSEQSFNTRIHKNNTSGRTGVYFHKKSGKWAASIRCVKQIWLGLYNTYEEAVFAREAAELKYFGKIKE